MIMIIIIVYEYLTESVKFYGTLISGGKNYATKWMVRLFPAEKSVPA
jgi:hypothetical protein